jgi:hypothetical protein
VLGSGVCWGGGHCENGVTPATLRCAVLSELEAASMEPLVLLLLRPLGAVVFLLGGVGAGREEH